jgi:hypothetical protein
MLSDTPTAARTRWVPPLWLLAFAGFFLLGGAWALATPYDGTPDEADHVYRAVGVAYGGWIASEGRWQTVPRSLHSPRCFAGKPTRPANCNREPGGDATPTKTATGAGRYNPVYYAIVGWPLRLWPDWNGILRARLLSAALVALLLGFALHSAVHWSRSPLLGAGLLAATTPMTMHMAGAINPSAIEIAAGTALFATLIPLLLSQAVELRRAQLYLAGAATLALAMVRAFGPLWLVIVIGILLVPSRRALLSRLRRSRMILAYCALVVFALVASAAWTVFVKTGKPEFVNLPAPFTFFGAIRFEIALRAGGYAQEMVGIMSWLDTPMPGWVYLIWWSVLGFFTLAVLALGGWMDRWRIIALTAATFGIPVLLDAIGVNTYGFVAQGRYVLPIAVGIPMIGGFVMSTRNLLNPAQTQALIRTFALLLLPLHHFCLAFTMVRWQSGTAADIKAKSANPLAGVWHPPLGSLAPLLLACAGLILLGICAWRFTRDPETASPSCSD